MNWIDKLEKKFGRYAIPNLTRYIIVLYGFGFFLYKLDPTFYANFLSLNAAALLRGQIWRILTFIICPPSYSFVWIIFSLLFYYFVGTSLESAWGCFKFNLYYLSGMLLHVLAAIISYLITGQVYLIMTTQLNNSLFLLFACLFPNVQFLLFLAIPIKAKWMALIDIIQTINVMIMALRPRYASSPDGLFYKAELIAAIASLLNFAIFFLSMKYSQGYSPSQIKRKHDFNKKARTARERNKYPGGVRHKCSVCGRTELDDPHLEFRYCSKCKGNHEYCQDHLFTHEHIK